MTPEAQRIAIAEACGWKPKVAKMYAGEKNVRVWEKTEDGYKKTIGTPLSFPDYLNDLNAMHKAEDLVGDGMSVRYSEWLAILWQRKNGATGFRRYWFATADIRAEAFLRTLNLWKE